MSFVVDASALAKLFADERGAKEFRAWHHEAVRAGRPLKAPSVLRYELGRFLQRALAGLPAAELADALDANLAPIGLTDPSSRTCFRVGAAGLTFPDAAYVALALEDGGTIVTSDAAMARAAKSLRVRVVAF